MNMDTSLSEEEKQMTTIRKRRWNEEENKFFRAVFQKCLMQHRLATGSEMDRACKGLPIRTRAQIRTKLHNIIQGKQKHF
jgi:hypothetical protein